ncbi:unnamed protein product [Didymodactylos carnosus]|uniref:PPPDE domain-containing protein n=1 Tax=Didymodactylos carnosus TaxID=1234261 RepID=A0A813VJ36_9BILA|nr:unnamed protein product [Didymodactylos carnosus]CAF0947492.1 unnamed protein product [Didymodactylos carnosus]CAF3631652.1 unnamed protein product [Didymodactylos carnosus]CAF3721988.1 unnamed protein product [Didymodactylos carnosus]
MPSAVKLYIYDISNGLASALGSSLLGKQIDGVWHTGVGVYGKEYLFGSSGISFTGPEELFQLGYVPKPKVVLLGDTNKTIAEVETWIVEQGAGRFQGIRYHLLDWNCNNFSNELCKYLLAGKGIPEDILDLPKIVKSTPLGRMLLSFLNNDPISVAQENATHSSNNQTADNVHMVNSSVPSNAKRTVRKSILSKTDITVDKIDTIKRLCKRSFNKHEIELLDDIRETFLPTTNYSPMLTKEHISLMSMHQNKGSLNKAVFYRFLLVSLMVNDIEDIDGQIDVLQLLQCLSEREHVTKSFSELKGQDSPIELLKGLTEQPEQIQIEFMKWFSSIASTPTGQTMLLNVEDDLVPIFTEIILNETYSKHVKYEIIVLLHNLLCSGSTVRVSHVQAIVEVKLSHFKQILEQNVSNDNVVNSNGKQSYERLILANEQLKTDISKIFTEYVNKEKQEASGENKRKAKRNQNFLSIVSDAEKDEEEEEEEEEEEDIDDEDNLNNDDHDLIDIGQMDEKSNGQSAQQSGDLKRPKLEDN